MTERFELLSQLGKGGMGTVWKARDTESGEIIALKLLHSIYVDDADYVARFEREVEVSQRIVSPNVVRVLGYGKRDGVPYVAMEYVDGKSLREIVHERGTLPWEEAKPILRQIAEGLGAAHAAGVIHRDVKPSNIMIDSAGTVKLADFGIARAMDLTRMTGGVTMLGTPAYMSPDIETTEQSDLYGLGCVLYELLTGGPPFVADSQQQVLMRHLRDVPDLENLPPGARKITGWLLEKDPRRRPASAAALLGLLDGSSKITRSQVAAGGPSRWRPALLVGAPTTLAIALIAGLVFLTSGGSEDSLAAAGVLGPAATSDVYSILATVHASMTAEATATVGRPRSSIATPVPTAFPTATVAVTPEASASAGTVTVVATSQKPTVAPTVRNNVVDDGLAGRATAGPGQVAPTAIRTATPTPTPTAAPTSIPTPSPVVLLAPEPRGERYRAFSKPYPVRIEWGPVSGATMYEVSVDFSAGGGAQSFPVVTFRTADLFRVLQNDSLGVTRWRVRAIGGGGELGPWSDSASFSYFPQLSSAAQ